MTFLIAIVRIIVLIEERERVKHLGPRGGCIIAQTTDWHVTYVIGVTGWFLRQTVLCTQVNESAGIRPTIFLC